MTEEMTPEQLDLATSKSLLIKKLLQKHAEVSDKIDVLTEKEKGDPKKSKTLINLFKKSQDLENKVYREAKKVLKNLSSLKE